MRDAARSSLVPHSLFTRRFSDCVLVWAVDTLLFTLQLGVGSTSQNSGAIHAHITSYSPTTLPAARRERVYADRTAGGNRDHRHPHRSAAAGRAEGPRGRRTHPVLQQPEADRA